MQNTMRHRIAMSLFTVSLALAIGTVTALAQSGSAGGSIGNDEKSLSGSRSAEPDRSARRSKPEADEPRRSTARRGGGGGGSFDGAWIVGSSGVPCGNATTPIVVSGGRIAGDGLSGMVSSSGAASSVGHYGSLTVISSGRFSGRGGSGTFRRSDGCTGSWTASKQ